MCKKAMVEITDVKDVWERKYSSHFITTEIRNEVFIEFFSETEKILDQTWTYFALSSHYTAIKRRLSFLQLSEPSNLLSSNLKRLIILNETLFRDFSPSHQLTFLSLSLPRLYLRIRKQNAKNSTLSSENFSRRPLNKGGLWNRTKRWLIVKFESLFSFYLRQR